MGANEKHEAAMHGAEYTPHLEDLRTDYVFDRGHDGETEDEARAEFDRFIAKIRAEAKAKALTEAAVEIDRLDSDVEMYDENLNATQVTFWLRNRANQYKEEA